MQQRTLPGISVGEHEVKRDTGLGLDVGHPCIAFAFFQILSGLLS